MKNHCCLMSWLMSALVLGSGGGGMAEEANPVRLELKINELPPAMRGMETDIRANILAAVRIWTDAVVAKPCSIEIEFSIRPWPARGFGHSVAGVPIGTAKLNDKTLVEEGMAYELRTGKDPNGTKADVEMAFDPKYVKTIWWDPNPATRKRPVPANMLDGITVMAHEIGHAIGFNGRLDPKSGQATAKEISPYDQWVTFDGSNFFFTGPAAMKVFRKEVPLSKTHTNYHHFGEPGPELDGRLKESLMNGIVFEYGKRYPLTELDLAILADCGLELKK